MNGRSNTTLATIFNKQFIQFLFKDPQGHDHHAPMCSYGWTHMVSWHPVEQYQGIQSLCCLGEPMVLNQFFEPDTILKHISTRNLLASTQGIHLLVLINHFLVLLYSPRTQRSFQNRLYESHDLVYMLSSIHLGKIRSQDQYCILKLVIQKRFLLRNDHLQLLWRSETNSIRSVISLFILKSFL